MSTATSFPRLAFLGLGRMGAPMACRLLDAGLSVAAWNRSAERAERLWQRGARRAESPADAARDADVVVTMLSDPAALHAVLDGARGVLSVLRPGSLLIDCSTVGPETARAVADLCAARGAGFVDAPVLGSVPAAEQGSLTILAGGAPPDVERATAILGVLGRTVVPTGVAGTASTLKLVMNLLVGGQTELMAEAFLLAERAGLSREIVKDALTGSVLNSPFVGYKAPQLLERNFAPLFTTALLLKDIDLALDLARTHALSLPGVRAVRDAYATASAEGRSDDDFSAVIAALDVIGDRQGERGPVTYEVSAEVAAVDCDRFEILLRDTLIRDVVRTGCFLHGRLERMVEGQYRITFLAVSHDAADRYLRQHAPDMQSRLAETFGSGLALSHRVWSERARWP